jgi:multiple sugar transport system substrate-binding protein
MNLEWAKVVGVIPIHKGAEKDPFFDTEQYRGWFTELNDPRWQLTAMPTYLEEFGFFADQISISGGQEMLLGQRPPEDVANEWAAYLTDAQKKWLASR